MAIDDRKPSINPCLEIGRLRGYNSDLPLMNYPSTSQILLELTNALIDRCKVDVDDFVYEIISEYDKDFEDDPEWFDEEDTDMKDSLRDEVITLLGDGT